MFLLILTCFYNKTALVRSLDSLLGITVNIYQNKSFLSFVFVKFYCHLKYASFHNRLRCYMEIFSLCERSQWKEKIRILQFQNFFFFWWMRLVSDENFVIPLICYDRFANFYELIGTSYIYFVWVLRFCINCIRIYMYVQL